MKYWRVFLLLLAASPAGAGHLDEVLKSVEGVTADDESFISQVTWVDNPEKAYYTCTDRSATPTLELWQGSHPMVRFKGADDQPLLYGENGPIVVLSYFKEERTPALAAYLILPSGETHLFRVNAEQHIAKSSKQWQCERQVWQEP